MIIDGNLEFDDLKKEAEEIQDTEKAAEKIRQYEDIIKTKKKGIINVAFHQGQIFKGLRKRKSLLSSLMNFEFTKPLSFFKLMFLNYVKNVPNY